MVIWEKQKLHTGKYFFKQIQFLDIVQSMSISKSVHRTRLV